jgi:hypothetical protein
MMMPQISTPLTPLIRGARGELLQDKAEKEITRVLGHPEPLQY